MIVLFSFFLSNAILVSVSSLGDKVHQTPADMYKKPEETAKITCSHNDQNYNQILWYKQSNRQLQFLGYMYGTNGKSETGLDVKIEGGANKGDTCTLTVNGLSLNSSAVYFCAASGGQGTEPAYFGPGTKLTVLEKGREVTPPTNESVKVFGPSSFECRNLKDDERKKTLLCVVSGFYPDHVSVFWQVNGKNETKGVATDNAAQWTDSSTEFYRITSRLRVPADDWNNPKNEFTCIISFFSGTDTTHYQNSIRGVEAQTKGVMTRDNYLRITQSAKLSYGIFIIKSTIYGAFVALVVWKLQGSTGKQNH